MNTWERKAYYITIAVQRNYKNSEGIYEADFIRCVLWEGIAARTAEFCKKGDLIAIRGQVRTRNYTDENSEKRYVTEIVVEKVSFLSSKPKAPDIIEESGKKENKK